MSDFSIKLEEKELRLLKYLISDCSNKELILNQLSPELSTKIKDIFTGVWLEPDDISNLQEAVNHLSYLDKNKYYRNKAGDYLKRKNFFESLIAKNENLFIELAEFVFLPASKRKLAKGKLYYAYDAETREEIADALVEAGLYSEKIIKHYFKLLAKSGSWTQKSRLSRWVEMPQVKQNKKLMLILASSKNKSVQKFAIDHIDKSLYGFIVGDISHPYTKWYLEKKMLDENFPSDDLEVEETYKNGKKQTHKGRYAVYALYRKETGKDDYVY